MNNLEKPKTIEEGHLILNYKITGKNLTKTGQPPYEPNFDKNEFLLDLQRIMSRYNLDTLSCSRL